MQKNLTAKIASAFTAFVDTISGQCVHQPNDRGGRLGAPSKSHDWRCSDSRGGSSLGSAKEASGGGGAPEARDTQGRASRLVTEQVRPGEHWQLPAPEEGHPGVTMVDPRHTLTRLAHLGKLGLILDRLLSRHSCSSLEPHLPHRRKQPGKSPIGTPSPVLHSTSPTPCPAAFRALLKRGGSGWEKAAD